MAYTLRTELGVVTMALICGSANVARYLQWHFPQDGYENIIFFTPFLDGLLLFLAAAIGAVVARGSFVGPAIALALVLQLLSSLVVYKLTPWDTFSIGFLDVFFGDLPLLAVDIPVVALGALLGGWYFKRELAQQATVSE